MIIFIDIKSGVYRHNQLGLKAGISQVIFNKVYT